MDNTLYVALSHQMASRRMMDVIANNIANMSTSGYRREQVLFEEYLTAIEETGADGRTSGDRVSFVLDRGLARDLSAGPLTRTGSPFDLAIDGTGYFTVETPDGERFTRNGHFQLAGDGRIVTRDGHSLLDDGGAPIVLAPEETGFTVAADGAISTSEGARGRLGIVTFANERLLEKTGDGLYASTQAPEAVPGARIRQGLIEGSNVQPIVEMTHMIEVQRAYSRSSDIVERNEELMRRAIQRLGEARA